MKMFPLDINQIIERRRFIMKVVETSNAPGAIGPYSQGYEVNELVFTSGQIPVNTQT